MSISVNRIGSSTTINQEPETPPSKTEQPPSTTSSPSGQSNHVAQPATRENSEFQNNFISKSQLEDFSVSVLRSQLQGSFTKDENE